MWNLNIFFKEEKKPVSSSYVTYHTLQWKCRIVWASFHLKLLWNQKKNWPERFETVIIYIKFRYGTLFSFSLFYVASSQTRISCQKNPAHQLFMKAFFFFFESLVSRFTHHSIMRCSKNDHIVTSCASCEYCFFFFFFISNLSKFAILLWPIQQKRRA